MSQSGLLEFKVGDIVDVKIGKLAIDAEISGEALGKVVGIAVDGPYPYEVLITAANSLEYIINNASVFNNTELAIVTDEVEWMLKYG